MLAKHPNVYADVSGLLSRPWQAYNALVSVYQHGVIDKLLFGSDYPFTTVNATLDGLRGMNKMLEGTALPRSIIEFYYKNDKLNDPMVSEEHVTAFGWASPQEIDDIMALAIRVNDFLSGLFLGVGIRLVDFKMECGRLWEHDLMRIVVADEWDRVAFAHVGQSVREKALRVEPA